MNLQSANARVVTGWLAAALVLGSVLQSVADDPQVGLSQGAKPEVLFNFDGEDNSVWNPAQGGLQVVLIPAPAGDGATTGKALQLTAKANGFLYTQGGKLPKDLAACEALTLKYYRSPEEAQRRKSSAVEIQFIEKGGIAKFWRKEDLTGAGWQTLVVPLRFTRWSGKRTPDWAGVEYLGIFFRDPAEVVIDDLALARSDGCSSRIGIAELRQMAFPDAAEGTVRSVDQTDLRVAANCPDLDLDELQRHLQKFVQAIRKDLPFIPEKPVCPPALIVFQTQKEYEEFPDRFAAYHHSQGSQPQSGGFTFMGVATSFWNPQYGTLRPVYGHEFLHAYIELTLGLSSGSGDWVQEGLVNHYQLQLHPQANFNQMVLDSLAKPPHHLPLKQLCNGRGIPLNRYWQALTVVRMFLEKDPYRQHLKEIFAAFTTNGTTSLDPILKSVLKSDWDQLDKDWRAFCEATYRVAP